MSEITTIQIKKNTKEKLDLLKKNNDLKSYDELIRKLLDQDGGSIVEDVITINRDSTALSLKYWDDDNFKSYDVTFQELKVEPVGTVFTANPKPVADNFVNSIAEIVMKKGDDVVLLVKEISCNDGKVDSISSVVHVNLF